MGKKQFALQRADRVRRIAYALNSPDLESASIEEVLIGLRQVAGVDMADIIMVAQSIPDGAVH